MTDTPPSPNPNPSPTGGAREEADGGTARDVRNLVETAVSTLGRAGTTSAASLADAVESAGRSLTRRAVDRSRTGTAKVADPDELARALADKPQVPALANAAGAALAYRTLSRFRALRFLGRRTPTFLLVGAVPALIASVSRGADELGLVAAHLAARARAQGIEPDSERLRRVAVQVVSGRAVDPDVEPRHGPLAVAWLKRAARAALPFSSGVATKDPDGLAATAAAVDPSVLRA